MPIPPRVGPYRRELLRDNTYATIRDAIVRGDFQPGERIRDADLVDWLGVSRTPIREAFLRLERAGLLETHPGKATFVAPISTDATRNAQQIVAALHGLAMELAVPRITDDDVALMEAANDRFEVALTAGDVDAALIADDDFHQVALDASGNARIAALLDEVAPLVRRVERLRFASLEGRGSVSQHAGIVDLCRACDGAAADAVRANWQTLAELLAASPPHS